MPKASIAALTLISSSELKADKAELAQLQRSVVENLRRMQALRNEEACRGLLVGMILLRVKNSMPHGSFGPWVKENVTEFGDRYAHYLMRLALEFADRMELSKPELLAIPSDKQSLAIETLEGARRRFVEKAVKFVGVLSLNELLIKYGIKAVGLKSSLETDGASGGPSAEDFFADVAERLSGFRSIVTSPEALMRLSPQQLDALDQNMEDIYGRWKRLREQAKGGAAITV